MKTLFKPPPADGNLTRRQQLALRLVRERAADGVTPEELGAAWHAARGFHAPERRCAWCGDTGLGLLKALRKRGLVKCRRADGAWTMPTPLSTTGYDPASAPIPFGEES